MNFFYLLTFNVLFIFIGSVYSREIKVNETANFKTVIEKTLKAMGHKALYVPDEEAEIIAKDYNGVLEGEALYINMEREGNLCRGEMFYNLREQNRFSYRYYEGDALTLRLKEKRKCNDVIKRFIRNAIVFRR
jgi:hypothetical protein